MSTELYQENVLDHGKHPRNARMMDDATLRIGRNNPLCGDAITLYIKTDAAGLITDISFTGSGCLISQAAASLFTEHVKGKKLADVRHMPREEMLGLLGVPVTPAREKCVVLPLDALQRGTSMNTPR